MHKGVGFFYVTRGIRFRDISLGRREAPREISLPCKGNCRLCVSLTAAYYDRRHYKLVATVLEGKP